jgi:hypothetical protein
MAFKLIGLCGHEWTVYNCVDMKCPECGSQGYIYKEQAIEADTVDLDDD